MDIQSLTYIGFLDPSDPRWSEVLQKTTHDFFHLPGYLAACASHEKGEPLLLLLEDAQYGMLIPLLKRPLQEFGNEFEGYFDAGSPYGYPGPLCWGHGWESRVPHMDEVLEAFLKEQRIVSLFLRLNPFMGISGEQFKLRGEFQQHGPTVYLDIRDEHSSWKAMSPRLRTAISSIRRQGCEVRFDEWETMDTVVDAYHESMSRLNAAPFYFFPHSFFHRLQTGTAPHFHLATSFSPSGEIMGGVFFSEVQGLIQYFLTGTFSEYRQLSPGKLLVNALRLWGLERGHHTLHLGGGLASQKENLFHFKSRFSKSFATFFTYREIVLPEKYSALSSAFQDNDENYFPVYRKPS